MQKSIIVTFINEIHNTKVNIRISPENFNLDMNPVQYLYTDPILEIKKLSKHQIYSINRLCRFDGCYCKADGKVHSNIVRVNDTFNAYLHDEWVVFNIAGYMAHGERWKHYSRNNEKIN